MKWSLLRWRHRQWLVLTFSEDTGVSWIPRRVPCRFGVRCILARQCVTCQLSLGFPWLRQPPLVPSRPSAPVSMGWMQQKMEEFVVWKLRIWGSRVRVLPDGINEQDRGFDSLLMVWMDRIEGSSPSSPGFESPKSNPVKGSSPSSQGFKSLKSRVQVPQVKGSSPSSQVSGGL